MQNICRIFLIVTATIFLNACSVNKAKIDNDLAEYFKPYTNQGCFTLLDNSTGEITVYNLSMDTTRVAPYFTFNILNALIALQNGIVTDENMVIKMDSTKTSNLQSTNESTIVSAFQKNNVSVFQEISRRLGYDTLQSWIDTVSYGNKMITNPVDSFWLNNKIKISPDEQLGLLKRLYFDQLPFRKSTQEQVRNMMIKEDNSAYKLSYVTGYGADEKNNIIDWNIGWIEENKHVYFFVCNTKSEKTSNSNNQIANKITKDILTHYGFFKGVK